MWDLHVGRMDRQAYLFIPPPCGETRASFLRWEHMYVKRKWLCVESYSVRLYLLRSCLLLGFGRGNARGVGSCSRRLHLLLLLLFFIIIILRDRMPT